VSVEDQGPPASVSAVGATERRAGAEDRLDALREARRELDEVIDEIQAVPGLEAFLSAPTFDDIAAAADDRPIVYVSAAEPGGLALIVRGSDVRHVPLDALSNDLLRGHVSPYLDAYSNYRQDPSAGLDGWADALDEVLRWLWDAALSPILDELADGSEPAMVAGGLLGLLPLHAAWTPDATAPTGRRYALDRAVFSYAPNARALSAARKVARDSEPGTVLVVVDPKPVSASPLRWAAVEGAVVVGAAVTAASGLPATVLAGVEATTGAFRREAGRAGVLHLACHGVADLNSPLDSGLLLAGNRWITLRELLDMQLHARLAILSACETSLPGTELPDEVVALPTGLLQAGVAGVIASQWAVPDLGTAILMSEFYRRWDGTAPAAALTAAQRWVRDTTNDEKVEEWQRALADRSPWLPADVGETLIDQLAFADPGARDHAEPRTWAAFAHVGV
jgi:CHAT domain-containing protein